MSQYRIKAAPLKGEIDIPPSKSHTLRAILFGTLGCGKTVIHNYLPSADPLAMIKASEILGAGVNVSADRIEINGLCGKISGADDVINAGNSGIVSRFCTAIGALSQRPIVITGDESIRHQRPMKPILEALSQLGASAVSTKGDGFAPIVVQGPIQPGTARFDGQDSQPVSALMIAAAFADGPIELLIQNAGEKPWIQLTLDWFDRLGIKYENHSFEHYRLFGRTKYPGFEYTVPGDFSSAAFPIAAALITHSELLIKNIDMQDVQGDKELIAVFQRMGAHIEIDESQKTLLVKKSGTLKGLTVDINNFIDAISILAVVSCFAEGETHITNAAIARQKECNRIRCTVEELKKMGADIEEEEDGIRIRRSSLHGAHVYSHKDHRMAMSLAVAGMAAAGETIVSSIECVGKTFPHFQEEFKALEADIEVIR